MDAQEFHVDANPRRAHALPAGAFTSEAFLERELASLFAKHWTLLPLRASQELRDDSRSLAEMVRTRGARAPVSVMDRPLFLQRDWDGGLHLFPNVCTHAWHTLVAGPGRERTIRCPQHGREFDCLGKFVHQPGFEKLEGFPTKDDHLRDFPAAQWEDLVFACLGAPVRAFDDVIAPVRASIGKLSSFSNPGWWTNLPRQSNSRPCCGQRIVRSRPGPGTRVCHACVHTFGKRWRPPSQSRCRKRGRSMTLTGARAPRVRTISARERGS